MAEPAESLPAPARSGIFEINLLGDRVQHMHRRVRLFQIFSALALVMVVAAGYLAAIAARNMIGYVRARQGAQRTGGELSAAQASAAELDVQRDEACQALGSIGALSGIACRRIAWAPKLAALAQAIPAGGGILSVEAQSGDIFWQAPPPAAPLFDKAGKVIPVTAPKPAAVASMKFSVLLTPALGGPNPIQFLERLQRSEAFMKQLSGVHIDAVVQESWMETSATVLTGSCAGSEEGKP